MAIRTNLTGDALREFRKNRNYRTRFFNEMYGAFLCGYQNETLTYTDRQCMFRASQDNLEIVSGVSGRRRYEYHTIMLSRGKMDVPKNVKVAYMSIDQAVISFYAPYKENEKCSRRVYIVQYNVCKRSASLYKMTFEDENMGLLFNPGENTYGDEIRYWLFVASEDDRLRSDSVYLGQIKPMSN